jgi:Holliday junction resolvasome RuvABC ATP-dependent DNA helicase subunit
MEFYIKTIHSLSDYFGREDNGYNSDVRIAVTESNGCNEEVPRHLIITGINGTGKTVLFRKHKPNTKG